VEELALFGADLVDSVGDAAVVGPGVLADAMSRPLDGLPADAGVAAACPGVGVAEPHG